MGFYAKVPYVGSYFFVYVFSGVVDGLDAFLVWVVEEGMIGAELDWAVDGWGAEGMRVPGWGGVGSFVQ